MQDSTPPVAVRLTRFLLWCVLLGAVFCLGANLILSAFQVSGPGFALTDLPKIFVVLTVCTLGMGMSGLTLRGIQQRRPYGRWLSVAFFVLVIIGSIEDLEGTGALSTILRALLRGELPPPKGELLDESKFDNSIFLYVGYPGLLFYAAIDALFALLLVGLPLLLTTRLIFSKAVKRFFS
jgi:hypothetical protein